MLLVVVALDAGDDLRLTLVQHGVLRHGGIVVADTGDFIRGIQNETLRRVIVAVIAIALCFSISLLGLTTITTKVYGYDGYYALAVVVLPALIWGIPKNMKLEAAQKK